MYIGLVLLVINEPEACLYNQTWPIICMRSPHTYYRPRLIGFTPDRARFLGARLIGFHV